MGRPLILAALPALLAIAGPVRAADLATIGCVSDKLDAAGHEKLVADIERNLRESGKRHTYAPETTAALSAAGKACAAENGWSDAAIRPALLYTIATEGQPVARRFLAERKFDTGALEAIWFGLPEEVRQKPVTPEVNRKLSDATKDSPDQSPEAAELVGEFFGFLSMAEYSSYDFSQA
ncbi:hypothetical protein [Sphingomonas sp.]|uniref:hypothetical protein n=1 Tax=Sphingomonas sp. TaxID=28214 RepID=UPI001B0C37F0|nr:hypothetical protein [Sphingomonas sp.]MBO9712137.1 hypothetical protein [Sphingomonas sp.]